MKKALTFFTVLFIATFANAQVNIGVRMRYTSADLQTSGGGQTTSSGKNYNADPGVFFDINRGDITFEPGLIFVLKGG